MHKLATIDLFGKIAGSDRVTVFRGRDDYCISDKRKSLKITGNEEVSFTFQVAENDARAGTAEVVIEVCLEIFDSQVYAWKHINSVLEIRINDTVIFDGIMHWRSHDETVVFWNPFDFPFDAALLRPGANTVTLVNKTSRKALGEFFDPQLLEEFSEEEAEQKLATLYLSTLQVNFKAEPPQYPVLRGVPQTAIANIPFVIEVSTGPEEAPVSVVASANARVQELGSELEFGEYRALFEVTPLQPGKACSVGLSVNGTEFSASVEKVYENFGAVDLITGPGAETTYWHQLKIAAQDFFALESGNCFRINIDDYLANLHFIPLEKWRPLISYLVRRRKHFGVNRDRVPPYSKIEHGELVELADMGGDLFMGIAVTEPINRLHELRASDTNDLAETLQNYLAYFGKQMKKVGLPGHPVTTFDCAGAGCGYYYRMGLDVYSAELGPSCNCVEEACARGAATAYDKIWGVCAAMHWYCGQGANYAYDDSRVRLAWLIMLSSYLAGSRQITFEGGCFGNLPVYNYLLTKESWRDYGRRYDDPEPTAVRRCFSQLLDFHRAQQLPSPKVRFAILQGQNDLFDGTFSNEASAHGDMSMARAWTLLKVFLPHFSFGRHGVDHGRDYRRWYSYTPYGQVDVIPDHADIEHFKKYQLLALLGWNTMSDDLYEKLFAYVENGGILFAALPHFCADTSQQHEWTFYRDGDLSKLCGIKARNIGQRLESVTFQTDMFGRHLPREYVLSRKNPLFVEDFDEKYPVFSIDVTYVTGQIEVEDAEVLATSQHGEPVLLRRNIGKGAVYLLNSYHHIGRGHLLDLAEGILRSLIEQQAVPIAVEDSRQVVSWFEYPAKGYTRFIFLNTDWTTGGNAAPVTVRIGDNSLSFDVVEGRPVQILSDGQQHVLVTDPSVPGNKLAQQWR